MFSLVSLMVEKIQSLAELGKYVWIIALGSLLIGLISFIIARIETRRKKKKEARTWLNNVGGVLKELGNSMGRDKLDLLLENVVRIAKGSISLADNPYRLFASNKESVKIAANHLNLLLNEGDKSHQEQISMLQADVNRIIQSYYVCFEDINTITQLCENNSFEEMRDVLKNSSASEGLRWAVNAVFDSYSHFDRGSIIQDIVGIIFGDKDTLNFEEELNHLSHRFSKSYLSSLNTDPWINHSSPGAMYEMAEDFLTRGEAERSFQLFQQAAEVDYTEALFRLAECYENGIGCLRDEKEASDYYGKAARKGFPIAEFRYGKCFEKGLGCSKDLTQAAYWYWKAANDGYLEAQYELALCYYVGKGIAQDNEKGKELLIDAANKGFVSAQLELGKREIEEGEIVVQKQQDNDSSDIFWQKVWRVSHENFNRAISWLEMAAKNDCIKAIDLLGCLYYLNRDIENAKDWLRKGVQAQSPYCMTLLGAIMDQTTNELFSSSEESADLYEKAAYLGFGCAQGKLSFCYALGTGRKKDFGKALQWANKAIANKYWPAYESLAVYNIESGNYGQAWEDLRISMQTANPFSFLLIGYFYKMGYGTQTDYEKGRYLFDKFREFQLLHRQGIVIPFFRDNQSMVYIDDLSSKKWYEDDFIFYYYLLERVNGKVFSPGDWYHANSK